MSRRVRTRYAPSPTGKLHLGGLRTSLFNYLFAKQHGGDFLLRIEDTDKSREVPGAIQSIENDLRWTRIHYDEGPSKPSSSGPFIQVILHLRSDLLKSLRIPIYQDHIEKLLSKGHAYRCFCTEERLSKTKQKFSNNASAALYDRHCLQLSKEEIAENLHNKVPFTIRMKVPEGTTKFKDMLRGKLQFQNSVVDDQILIKSDGFPTYHFANIVDDHLMDISHVIRGDEWIASTPKHILLYHFFGWEPPEFAHLPLLVNEQKHKLSKREGHASVDFYIEKGYFPEALVNFVAMLGWAPNSTQEIFTMEELIQNFSFERVHKSPAVVNPAKLDWFNQHWLRVIADKEPQRVIDPIKSRLTQLHVHQHVDDSYIKDIVQLLKDRATFPTDIANWSDYFFHEPDISQSNPHSKTLWKPDHSPKVVASFLQQISNEQTFEALKLQQIMKKISEEFGIGIGELYKPLRFLLTGTVVGAGVPQTMQVLGREESMKRLSKYNKV